MIKNLIVKAFRLTNSAEKSYSADFSSLAFKREATLAEVPSPRHVPIILEDALKGGFKVRIRKGLKRMTLFRFLMAKAIYEENGLHLDEFLVLFDLYYFLRDLNQPGFKEKYEEWFERTEEFFSILGQAKTFPLRVDKDLDLEPILLALEPVIPSQRAYLGLRGQKNLRSGFEVTMNSALNPPKLKPKRVIGVGYRDKGTRRDTAYDGSPSWQEVGRHFSELERRAEEELFDSNGHLGPPKNGEGLD
jgi:hypothetical protein